MHFSADVHVFNFGEAHFFVEVKPWHLLAVIFTLLSWNWLGLLARGFAQYLLVSLHVLHGISALLAAALELLWNASTGAAISAELAEVLDHQRA